MPLLNVANWYGGDPARRGASFPRRVEIHLRSNNGTIEVRARNPATVMETSILPVSK